jgi:hypothetical protein
MKTSGRDILISKENLGAAFTNENYSRELVNM